MITSSHNARIQKIRELLNDRQERSRQKLFVLEGVRLVEEAVRAAWPLVEIYYDENLSDRGRRLLEYGRDTGISMEEISRRVSESISDTGTSQGILAIAAIQSVPENPLANFFLIIDSVRDPGNLGALLRTAAAAGVDQVLLTPGTADAYNPKVVRSAMGAHFHLPIRGVTWEEIKSSYKSGRCFFLAEMEASTSLWDADFRQPLAVIVGGEAEGAGDEARLLADESVKIPMSAKTESLNAAVAASIILFEVVRQRKL